jgi:hypothetical protein
MKNALNLEEINQETALVLAKFAIKNQMNFFLFGQKGTGKTEIAMQAIKDLGYTINYINLSVIERNDLVGFPNMNSDTPTIEFKLPNYMPPLDGDPNMVILFDEVDKADPEVLHPLLELLQFKKINGKPINVISCILTGNLPEEKVYQNQVSRALLDRGSKYILRFDFDQWMEWAKTNGVHDLILGFLKNNPQYALSDTNDAFYASPSPRSWTLASQSLIKAKELKILDIDTVTQIISGHVGAEAGLVFKMWYEYYRKFETPIHLLIERGEMTIDFADLVPTEKLIFVISACYHAKMKVLSDSKGKQKFGCLERLCAFFEQYKVDPEVQVMGLHNAFTFDQVTKHKLYNCKVFFNLFSKLGAGTIIKK